MVHPKDLSISDFSYELPDERIARYPLPERDRARLLVYREGAIAEDVYHNLPQQLPSDSLMIFNQTKVVYARLFFRKPTGGMIEVFCLEPHSQYPDIQSAMVQTKKVWWNCMIGGAGKWKHGITLTQHYPEHLLSLSAAIAERGPGFFTLELSWNRDISFGEVLHLAGSVPLPPYLHREAEDRDKHTYQTIYAREEGSVAAPTAGLHFTPGLMERLHEAGVDTRFVTLHVGAGTFKPVKADTLAGHDMHAEWLDVSLDLVQELRAALQRPIVAVGTTSLRTLESLYWIGVKLLKHTAPDFSGIAVHQWDPYELSAFDLSPEHALKALADWMLQHHQQRLVTRTQILIAPGYEFKIVKGLITNFHQPQSTLLLLIAAFIGQDWRRIYDYALEHDFRFLSYGDGSLLWRKFH